MRSSTPSARSSPHQIHTPHFNDNSSSSSSSFSSSSALSSSLLPLSLPHLTSKQPPSADTHSNAATLPASSLDSCSSVTAPTVTAASPSSAVAQPPSSPSSTPHGTKVSATATMSDAATESHDDDPSALITKPDEVQAQVSIKLSTPTPATAPAPAPAHLQVDQIPLDSASRPLSSTGPSALPSATTSPGVHSPQPTSTISTLQLASDALSTIPQFTQNAASVPTAAAELLSAIQRRNKKAPAIQSPHPTTINRSRSLATTPVPPSLLLGVKHDSLDVTAASSRATTPTRTPSGRAKRQRRERNPATPIPSVSALPSIDQNDRRRSARVAKAVTESASDSPSLPNLAMFGFSPYLENLVLNAKDSDRRTRSGARGIRPAIDRAPAKLKRSAAKNSKTKSKEADPDDPDDDVKMELYHQLCIISYQLQADLDMVPHKSLAQLRAQFSTPSPEREDHPDAKSAPAATADAPPGSPSGLSRAATPPISADFPGLQHVASSSTSAYVQPITVKAEPPQSPPLSTREPNPSRPPYSPESSPEVALMDTVRPAYNGVPPYHAGRPQETYPPYADYRPEPNSWNAKRDEPEDEPMSPVFRPARSNIMSISALMSGPSSSKPRTATPELIQTPPRPPPLYMQEWTHDDEMASQFLQACADAVPKLDTTELDRLTQIAQLAAFDLEILSMPSSPHPSTPSLSPTSDQQQRDASAKSDPKQLDPLKTLDTQQLYDREEAEYAEEQQTSDELYETVRYLASFDEVVDEWRAGELARLRLQLEMRKVEVERIWTCDRKLAWSTFVDDRAGELYRKEMVKAHHTKWQAEMELDLLQVHRRKTRGLEKLTKDIWLPKGESGEVADVYKRYGRFASGLNGDQHDPLVRGDLRKMREGLWVIRRKERREEEVSPEQTEMDGAAEDVEAGVATAEGHADAISVCESDSEQDDSDEDYDSDSSYESSSSGISSLPSFTSIYSSPPLPSIAEIDLGQPSDLDGLRSEVASLGGGDADSDEDADESLWARQLRLAGQVAEQQVAESVVASAIQTPIVAPVVEEEMVSAMPSRAASPVHEGKAVRKRGTKRKKRPPPPGARLWKKGRVQQDTDGEQVDEPTQQSNEHHSSEAVQYPNGDLRQHDIQTANHSAPAKSHAAIPQHETDYHRDQQRPFAPYNSYGMRPSYIPFDDEYRSYPPSLAPPHEAYAAYPYQPATADPYYPPPTAAYPNGSYGRTPPPPMHHHGSGHLAPSYGQFERAVYPSHPPPPQQNGAGAGAADGRGRGQWPY